ncbi:ISL3 family transposase [Echinimonas agarilytica]|uniref:ISL3 family transposase n=1 Tax=Echinimonas agarilytica TaxID=1215918 RepID=A0AA42BB76_9GAMM|nr:ISL3 family transposase [Echinimonas agarilytica]MCM2681551.1 ISL3 family transposase [Echinimonas agarilytica]
MHDLTNAIWLDLSVDQRTLYERILKLSSPWFVSEVQLDEQSAQIIVHIERDKSVAAQCPSCGQSAPKYDTRRRSWRHLDTCQFQTIVVADVPRVNCPHHGCLTTKVPWAEDKSRYTAMFEGYVIQWLKQASIYAVSKQMKLSWSAIDGIMARAVQRGLARRHQLDTRQLAVDEVSFKKGHDYVTVVSNHAGHVLAVTEGRSAQSLASFYQTMTHSEQAQVQSISMDMSPAYLKATREHIQQAHRKISFDHFHVVQKLNEALWLPAKRS